MASHSALTRCISGARVKEDCDKTKVSQIGTLGRGALIQLCNLNSYSVNVYLSILLIRDTIGSFVSRSMFILFHQISKTTRLSKTQSLKNQYAF